MRRIDHSFGASRRLGTHFAKSGRLGGSKTSDSPLVHARALTFNTRRPAAAALRCSWCSSSDRSNPARPAPWPEQRALLTRLWSSGGKSIAAARGVKSSPSAPANDTCANEERPRGHMGLHKTAPKTVLARSEQHRHCPRGGVALHEPGEPADVAAA